tara:strand:- start:12781 stop:13146 length:366 start_codon:yes stop_codon:yes gene_type:complete
MNPIFVNAFNDELEKVAKQKRQKTAIEGYLDAGWSGGVKGIMPGAAAGAAITALALLRNKRMRRQAARLWAEPGTSDLTNGKKILSSIMAGGTGAGAVTGFSVGGPIGTYKHHQKMRRSKK